MRLRFSLQIIIGAVAIQVAMVSLLVWNTTHQIRESHTELLVRSAEQQSLLMTSALVPGLAYSDAAMLQDVLQLVSGQPDLVYAVVIDAGERRLAVVGTPPESLLPVTGTQVDERGQVHITRRIDLAGQSLGLLGVGYSPEGVNALSDALLERNVTLGIAMLALSILAAVLFGLVITRRLRRLDAGARAFRAGRLDHRIPPLANDEMGDLARTLNALASDLGQSQSTLRQQNLKLNRSVERMEALLRGAEAVLWEAEPATGQWRFVNGDTQAILGISAQQIGQPGIREARVHADDLPRLRETYRQAGPTPSSVDYRYRSNEASWVWLRDIVSSASDSDGHAVLRGLTLDVSPQRQAALALKDSESRYREVIEHVSEVIFRTDHQGRWTLLNPAWEELTGYSIAESLGRPVSEFVSAEDSPLLEALTNQLLHGNKSQLRDELRLLTRAGEPRWVSVFVRSSQDAEGRVIATFGTLTDITERKRAEEEIRRLAFYDSLTELPNRSLLYDRLRLAMASAARSRHHGAILFLDLDNFKDINDTLGHDVGDELLRQVASRMQGTIRETDTLARLGGDEFVIILNDLHPEQAQAAVEAETLGSKLLHLLAEPFRLGEHERHCTPSIGATLFGDGEVNVDELLKQADLAMYRAKDSGRNTLCFFEPEMHQVVKARAAPEADFRKALREDQLHLHYQPHVDDQGHILGAEALLRWSHPERGMVPPMEFIAVAEQTGLIIKLGRWVLQTACQQLALWHRESQWMRINMAVNVSAKQFRHPDFVREVAEILQSTGAPAQHLVLELTESLLLEDTETVITRMNALRELGVGFALDDFGTGYSSLSYLKRLPLSLLKIDQSFVRDILVDANDAAIAEMIITLAKTLGLEVIAEGVETPEQRDFLLEMGCHQFQGYLFGRPGPVDQLEKRLVGRRTGTHN
ncbi:EAL domain-containing protein [Thioalkalivibrio sulfidiphilus]|uniref:EAL domain-containing protein n=1 Tax=Thioalkalivibrio sulfidiphilus TaxID=1033854 RepID=UPI003BAF7731